MRNKKKMIAIVGAALALIVAAAVVLVYKSNEANIMLQSRNNTGEIGIGYGGSFDEFEPLPEADYEMEEPDDVGDFGDEEDPEAIEEHLTKIREEFEKNKPAVINPSGRERKFNNDTSDNNTTSSDSSEVTDSDADDGEAEIALPVQHSKGYSENEVICDAQSREDAENIASQISGTLVSWNNGLATIQISGSVDDLLAKLEQEGSNLMLYRKYYY